MTHLLQDAAGCAETRRYARWFADRPEAMWLLRKAHNERMTTMPAPDLINAVNLAARMDRAATDLAAGQLPENGQPDCNAAATTLRLQAVELEQLRESLAEECALRVKDGEELERLRSILEAAVDDGLAVQGAAQVAPAGWKVAKVSDGDIRVYGPDRETWLIRKDSGEGFYDFIHRFFDDLAAAPAQQAAQVPPGYALVPVELTPEMLAAGRMADDESPGWESVEIDKAIWRAQLAASTPQPQVQNKEPTHD